MRQAPPVVRWEVHTAFDASEVRLRPGKVSDPDAFVRFRCLRGAIEASAGRSRRWPSPGPFDASEVRLRLWRSMDGERTSPTFDASEVRLRPDCSEPPRDVLGYFRCLRGAIEALAGEPEPRRVDGLSMPQRCD